ncbi:uncharacterized protein [Channa argus]|uniref:uncharacterized protein isoform X4 n=1 Tax=Channa argus TaxID=215402 RepID=UPI0035201749
MKVTVYSCWFFLVLGSNAAAEIIQKVFEEKQQISLPCPPPVDPKVTWSRETNGHKVDILTVHDRDEKHINDPDKRFSSLGDKSLYISRAAVSDSGTYFCNNKKAVELTVIPSEPTKPKPTPSTSTTTTTTSTSTTIATATTTATTSTSTTIATATTTTTTTTSTSTTIATATTTTTTSTSTTIATATTTATTSTSTTIATATTTATTSTSTTIATATTTSTTSQPNPAALMVGVTVPFTVLIIIIITIVYFTRRRRCKRRAVGPATFSMTPFSGASDQTEPTYSTICEYPPTEIKMATESPYSLISGTVVDGNNKGQTELNYSTYVLLDKSQTPANNHDHL